MSLAKTACSLRASTVTKLCKHQVTWLRFWLLCKAEALSITAAVKHFSPFIIQSKLLGCVLTDSQPCVQVVEKLCRGGVSASSCITSFSATVSRYLVRLQHIAGNANLLSDFVSRNAPECNEPQCQMCSFIQEAENSVVRGLI